MNVSRIAVAGSVAASTVLLLAGPAVAHVSVQPQGEAAKGGYATINFKVPNERDKASTNKLEVSFPVTEHPLASVMPQPVPGWTVKVEKAKLAKPLEIHGKKITEAVSKVTWTGGKIGPGEFQQFPLSVGQLPEDADELVFKALQTYDNNEVVRWIEVPQGDKEPALPAPVLKLSAASDDHHGGGAKGAEAKDEKSEKGEKDAHAEESASSDDGDSSDTTARALGIAGIVVGVAGLAFGFVASRRRARA
ncbi:YcnI family protein [Streptomyces sp. NPDC050504]|uniref:YcnI family protein n=1 Tax=Streptomyces sp. NPDC050504 TaxID=3365618 RepID=UPI0037B479BE